ncbi:Cytochrome p450 [Thalictrum thalictroides]|uniref:Cytochrome p450 n=1 Tax=Thalictrum thalictroides TaxID=46969 RepID=A0A7J6WGG0_THATH|nr:Cytochrome p450 [Thalictrum thalictroides]
MVQLLSELQSLHPISLSFLSILFVLFLFKLTTSRTGKLNLPPSPWKLPVIGNLHQLGTLPHRSLQSLARKHGPLMLLHFGQSPTLIVSSVEGAKEILKTQDLNFSDRPRMNFQDRLVYANYHLAFSPYGEYWRQVRKVCVLQLLSQHRVNSFKSVRQEETDCMLSDIRQSILSGSPIVNLSDLIFSFTNDVTCRVTLGRKFGRDEGGKKFFKIIKEFMYFIGAFNIGDFIPSLAWINNFNGLNARMDKNFEELESFLGGVIEEHIQDRKTRKFGSEGVEDFVDVLLGMEKDGSIGVPFAKDNIKALIMDMFLAATDTAAATMTWAMTELVRHPEILKEVQREVREVAKGKAHITEDDAAQMHYMKNVIKETLRVHTPGPLLIPHQSRDATKLQGYDVPAKTRVIVNAWAIARDPTVWEEPDEFRPKRFENSSRDFKGNDFEYLPFGAGRRICPGIAFANPTMELPLANLLYHFDWTLPNGEVPDVEEGLGIVAYKKSPLRVIATPYRV